VVGGEPLVVAIIDADHFKRINDTLSHAVGDRAITGLARALETSVARMDSGAAASAGLVGRLGGEEFLALLPVSDPETVVTALDSIRAAVAGYDWSFVADGVELTVSIGATAVHPEDSASEVLRRADAQLYMAKRGGRNRVSFDQPIRGQRPSRSSRHGTGRRAAGA
jgi:diguanylate cyclase (GGDEF)-like protein